MKTTFEAISYKMAKTVTDLSQTKWNKLMFLLDGVSYCRQDQSFTGFTYIKLPYGPVPNNYRSLLNAMNDAGFIAIETNTAISDAAKFITPKVSAAFDAESDQLIKSNPLLPEALEIVLKIFGDWSAATLSEFSHLLDAWKSAAMFEKIDLGSLKNDPYLKKEFGQENLADIILG